VVTSNWPGGYCVTLEVTNGASIPTANWSVSLNTNAAAIYTSWNGNFSGSSGVIAVTPAFPWNQVIPASATNTSVGFCANRTVPGSGTLPIILGASGTF
jgi:cellulase/cellobiase CelA1